MIKGFIFDLDGVIVDTAKYHYKAWKDLAGELGFEFSQQDNEKLKGVSRMASLDILLETGSIKNMPQAEKLALAEKKNKQYVKYISQMHTDEILPGALDFLKESKRLNIKTALGSASKNAMRILERVDILKYFEVVIDGNKVSKAKPNPEVFLTAAEQLEIRPQECIVFEDAQAGIEAAKKGSFRTVGIGDKTTLKNAEMVLEGLYETNPEAIINAIGKI